MILFFCRYFFIVFWINLHHFLFQIIVEIMTWIFFLLIDKDLPNSFYNHFLRLDLYMELQIYIVLYHIY